MAEIGEGDRMLYDEATMTNRTCAVDKQRELGQLEWVSIDQEIKGLRVKMF